jgi:PEGA domain
MKCHLFHSLISLMILAGLIIFFTISSGCVQYLSPSERAAQQTGIPGEMPVKTPEVPSGPTLQVLPLSPGMTTEGSTQSTGSLTVWSSPPACSVYIDGMYVGDTPVGGESFTKSIKRGPHTVKITKIGYEDYTQNVNIPVGKSVIVTAVLSEKAFPYYTLGPTSTFTESIP